MTQKTKQPNTWTNTKQSETWPSRQSNQTKYMNLRQHNKAHDPRQPHTSKWTEIRVLNDNHLYHGHSLEQVSEKWISHHHFVVIFPEICIPLCVRNSHSALKTIRWFWLWDIGAQLFWVSFSRPLIPNPLHQKCVCITRRSYVCKAIGNIAY